ncbi:MAG: Mur ligase family protein [Candidatus Auribacterota bacterium]|jgi:UDP-N-acetylmuramate--alanine ligase|nr:Mur ligase family protein [Candidatus Auribacterota bacterium]
MENYYFVGIAGTGMSRLALLFTKLGIPVSGSDRFYPDQQNHPMLERLAMKNIPIYPQDGSGITEAVTTVVISAAIERDNPDLKKAVSMGIPIITRSQLLADFFDSHKGYGITGTSGKTTITGMVTTVLRHVNYPHTYYCGDDICDELPLKSPCLDGDDVVMIAEIDESDGSPVLYHSQSAVISNVSLDHKGLGELLDIFEKFANQCADTLVMNADCLSSMQLKTRIKDKNIVTFGIHNPADYFAEKISLTRQGVYFECKGLSYHLRVQGLHNCYNALSAIALLDNMGIDAQAIRDGMEKFNGMHRRLELVAKKNDIHIYDDFSHNPEKMYAALNTLKQTCMRLYLIFRPHGFGPMLMLRKKLVESICNALSASDMIFFLDIFDAGGTADRSIHASDLVADLQKSGMNAVYVESMETVADMIKPHITQGETVVVMGARDPYLSRFARKLASDLLGSVE